MGVVYTAHDGEIDRRVAIKLVHEHAVDPRQRKAVLAEARLSLPNVVQIYEVGEHEQLVYLAMEYVAGRPLGECRYGCRVGVDRGGSTLDPYRATGYATIRSIWIASCQAHDILSGSRC